MSCLPAAQLGFPALLITALRQQQEKTKVWAKTTSFRRFHIFWHHFGGCICFFNSVSPAAGACPWVRDRASPPIHGRRAQLEAVFHKHGGGKQLEPSQPLMVRKQERDFDVAKYFCYSCAGTVEFQTSLEYRAMLFRLLTREIPKCSKFLYMILKVKS